MRITDTSTSLTSALYQVIIGMVLLSGSMSAVFIVYIQPHHFEPTNLNLITLRGYLQKDWFNLIPLFCLMDSPLPAVNMGKQDVALYQWNFFFFHCRFVLIFEASSPTVYNWKHLVSILKTIEILLEDIWLFYCATWDESVHEHIISNSRPSIICLFSFVELETSMGVDFFEIYSCL